jgi:hypothetical protein
MKSDEKKYLEQLSNEVFEANLRKYFFVAVAEFSPEFDATAGDQTEKTIYYINLCDRLVSSRLNFDVENMEDLMQLSGMVFECYQERFNNLEYNDTDFHLFTHVFMKMGEYITKNGPLED